MISLLNIYPQKALTSSNETPSNPKNSFRTINIGHVYQKRPLTLLPTIHPLYHRASIQMAIDEFNSSEWSALHRIRIDFIPFEAGERDLDIVREFNKALSSDVVAVVGLGASKEVLLIGDIAQRQGLLSLSTSSADDAIGRFGDYIYTGANSMSSFVTEIIKLTQKFNGHNVLIIANYDDPYSQHYATLLDSRLTSIGAKVTKIMHSKKATLNKTDLTDAITKQWDVVIIPTYPFPGVMYLNALQEYSIITNQPVIVPAPWHFDSITVEKNLKKAANIFCLSAWSNDWDDDYAQSFSKRFRDRYGAMPMPDAAHVYDATKLLILAIQNSHTYTRKSVKNAFKSIINYRGSTGWYHYDDCTNHPRKNFFLLHWTDQMKYELKDVYMRKRSNNCQWVHY